MKSVTSIITLLMAILFISGCLTQRDVKLSFKHLDKGIKVTVDYVLINREEISIDDVERVKDAYNFIAQRGDIWKEPGLSPTPAPLFWLTFYDVNEQNIGSYGVGSEFLVYGRYWRPLSERERQMLTEALNIPFD